MLSMHEHFGREKGRRRKGKVDAAPRSIGVTETLANVVIVELSSSVCGYRIRPQLQMCS
jgi:hypothetical protein